MPGPWTGHSCCDYFGFNFFVIVVVVVVPFLLTERYAWTRAGATSDDCMYQFPIWHIYFMYQFGFSLKNYCQATRSHWEISANRAFNIYSSPAPAPQNCWVVIFTIIFSHGSYSHWSDQIILIIVIPGIRHMPLGSGIWDFVTKAIFPQGWIFVVVVIVVVKYENATKTL